MKYLRLFTAIMLFAALSGCERNEEAVLTRTSLLSGANETPAVTTSATGTVSYTYSRAARTLYYSVAWSGLSGNATAAHIHGLAHEGFPAAVFQDFGSAFPKTAAGTYTGNLAVDGFAVTEANLLAGRYYVNIHTAANPGGELRAQIKF